MSGEKKCCQSVRDWIGSPSSYIYSNYILSAWGDRMWQFATGIYLYILADESLRLSAIFGFTNGVAILLFGSIIGNWIDRNGRLKVARLTLFIQNTSVMLSAAVVLCTLHFKLKYDTTLRPICDTGVIVFAIIAQLASMGYKIAIEKDWICVIASGNTSLLSNLNAVIRAIDLTCQILAPTTAGLIMKWGSLEIAALAIVIWNVVSVVIEYILLVKVYKIVPDLALPKTDKTLKAIEMEKMGLESTEGISKIENMSDKQTTKDANPANKEKSTLLHKEKEVDTTDDNNSNTSVIKDTESDDVDTKGGCSKCVTLFFEPLITLVKGWRTYAKQKVLFAGLSLATLYMTVLGFDSITLGYIYANNVSEDIVGVAMALAGLTGVIGTFFFTFSRKRIGLERTGLFAFNAEIACLTLCVMSIWTPGSLFDPHFKNKITRNCTVINSTNAIEIQVNGNGVYSTPESVLNIDEPLPREKRSVFHEGTFEHAGKNVDDKIQNVKAKISGEIDDLKTNIDSKLDNIKLDINSQESSVGTKLHNVRTFMGNKIHNLEHSIIGGLHKVDDDFSSFMPTSDSIQLPSAQMFSDGLTLFPANVGRTSFSHRRERRAADNNTDDSRYGTNDDQSITDNCGEEQPKSGWNISVVLFLVGIVTSRTGLWMADLVVTQLFQENVVEKERGVVNGVQNSLNMLLDMVKFSLVIAVPHIETFGILIVVSFCFIIFASCLFAYHSWKVRGHLFHFDRICSGRKHLNGGPKSPAGDIIVDINQDEKVADAV